MNKLGASVHKWGLQWYTISVADVHSYNVTPYSLKTQNWQKITETDDF